MFDLTNQKSFQSLQQWTHDIRLATPGAKFIIVGNKTDLTNKMVVSTVDGKSFAESISSIYAETTALDKNSVHDMFSMITSHIYNDPCGKQRFREIARPDWVGHFTNRTYC